jgi:hypothetical protein
MLTPSTLTALRAHRLPGGVLAGVLADWSGIILRERAVGEFVRDVYLGPAVAPGYVFTLNTELAIPLTRVHLPLARPESRWRVACVLEKGVGCAAKCDKGGVLREEDGRFYMARCPACGGTGYEIPPTKTRHLLPQSELGDLPDALAGDAGELMGWHVALVLGGKGGVRGIVPEWYEDQGSWYRDAVPGVEFLTCVDANGWTFAKSFNEHITGPETGPEGMARADAAALSAGFALVNAGRVVCGWEGVAP